MFVCFVTEFSNDKLETLRGGERALSAGRVSEEESDGCNIVTTECEKYAHNCTRGSQIRLINC